MSVTSRLNPETKTITFNVFGKRFNYEVDADDRSNYKLENIVPILSESIVEAHWEHSRKDDKKVLLFYKQSSRNYGYIEFSFCVEADQELEVLKNSGAKMSELIRYMFANRDKLNFDVPSNYRY